MHFRCAENAHADKFSQKFVLQLLLLSLLSATLSAESQQQGIFISSFSASPQETYPAQPVEFSVSVSAIAGTKLPFSASVEIYDRQNRQVGTLNYSASSVSEGQATTLRREWQSGALEAGPYLAVAKIFSEARQVASSQLFFAIAEPGSSSTQVQANQSCRDYSCTETEGCADGYRTLYCKSSKGCTGQDFFRVEKCLSKESLEAELELGICGNFPFLCSQRGIKRESYASACLLPTLAIALFIVFLFLSLLGRRKPRLQGRNKRNRL